MQHRIARILVLILVLAPLAAASARETAPDLETPSSVMVTFNGGLAGKSANKPVPGKNYRYRSRYRVSAAMQQNAQALAADYNMTLVDDWPIESLGVYCVVYAPARSAQLAQLLEKLNRDPRVESAQEMHIFESKTSQNTQYNDPYAGYQYALELMGVSKAQEYADGKGVKIAVIDSGVDLRHEDFLASRIRSQDFVPTSRGRPSTAHGTAVISLIVANPNNGKGIVGIAPAANLTSLRACWATGDSETARCDSFTLAKALDYVVRSRSDLINLSISGPRDPLLGRLIDKVLQNGTVIVAAQPTLASDKSDYPAAHAGVIAVSAAPGAAQTLQIGALLAPGEQIMVALPNNTYDFRSGSSLAAANVSGVIALLLERVPDLDGVRIAAILRRSQSGAGQGSEIINACRALAELEIAHDCQ